MIADLIRQDMHTVPDPSLARLLITESAFNEVRDRLEWVEWGARWHFEGHPVFVMPEGAMGTARFRWEVGEGFLV